MAYELTQLITQPEMPLAYRIREPQSGQIEGSPCLLLLHGVGANELGLVDIAARVDPKFTVILVRSPIQFGPMQFGFFQVNFTQSGPKINAEQAEGSRQLLVSFIEGLHNLYGIDAQKIWISGFSQGGILSASVALTRPDLVKGFGILSGRILPEISPMIAPLNELIDLHAFISHGLNDAVLTVEFARSAQKLLLDKGIQLTYQEYNAGHELIALMQDDFHEWLAKELDESSSYRN